MPELHIPYAVNRPSSEVLRMQGFPDYFTFVGHGGDKASSWVRNDSVTHRYQQLGNAVCPLVAEALGRCLALAAAGKAPSGAFVVSVPNEEYDECGSISWSAGIRIVMLLNACLLSLQAPEIL